MVLDSKKLTVLLPHLDALTLKQPAWQNPNSPLKTCQLRHHLIISAVTTTAASPKLHGKGGDITAEYLGANWGQQLPDSPPSCDPGGQRAARIVTGHSRTGSSPLPRGLLEGLDVDPLPVKYTLHNAILTVGFADSRGGLAQPSDADCPCCGLCGGSAKLVGPAYHVALLVNCLRA
ncbi:hypothetical protein XELAEV_18003940mg [Xenopus laevis]|nr:hypothetical protein XELAEV_18003940mg [Xenopus laevis]